MKTLTLTAGRFLSVHQDGAPMKNLDGSAVLDAQGNPQRTGTSWTFSSLADARRQRGEFSADLDAPENAAVKAALG